MHSYQIVVSLRKSSGSAEPIVTLFAQTKNADLEVLLRALDADIAVTSMSVFNTFTIPDLPKMGKLTVADLGIELKKLK